MQVHRDINQLPTFKATALTIGSYDGVHRGHQQILHRLNELASHEDCESVVLTFYPHPRQVLGDADNLELLQTLREKIDFLSDTGIDHLVVIPFTKEFAAQDPHTYVESFLIKNFKPRFIVIGYDHRFGKDRAGDVDLLKKYESEFGFETIVLEKQVLENITISSSKIRKALRNGQIKQATNLLGHPYQLGGEVVHGENIGASLGFPTANIQVKEPAKLIPPDGIYAVQVKSVGQIYGGMLYIGTRPTLPDIQDRMIEVNIFNFSRDIYGEYIQVELLEKIRDDQEFDSLEDLRAQLAKDRDHSLSILQSLQAKAGLPEVAIVILNYNGKQYLAQFLQSVQESEYENLSIYVADNGSVDDSLAFLHNSFPQVHTLNLGQNYGFAGGYNKALAQIEADYYVLLNSDVAVEKDWLNKIINWIEEDPYLAAAQPKVLSYNQPGQFEYAGASGGFMDRLRYPLCRGRVFDHLETDQGQYDEATEVFWASGCALVIRSQSFHAIGGFDASLFAHFEEIDLCWRLKKAGYKIGVYPKSVIHHVGGGTLDYHTPFKTFLNFRNSLICIFRNESIAKAVPLLLSRLLLDFVAGFHYVAKGQIANMWAIVKAHWSFFTTFPTHIKHRNLFREKIRNARIGPPNTETGMINKFIIWEYFVRGKRKFSALWESK